MNATRTPPYSPDQWPTLVGYGAFFLACCVVGAAVGYAADRMRARRR